MIELGINGAVSEIIDTYVCLKLFNNLGATFFPVFPP